MSDNTRIAKNAVFLYIRMFISMIVGLYTSRVVLNTLGVEDYGIYGVVGGVVGMMGFLNASMAGATSRFITFELGRGDYERLTKTFSSAIIVHIGIAIIVFVLAETIGLWFLNSKLVIPAGRMHAAQWVYQLSIASTMLGITQAPYSAVIMSHEKMDIYAYFELLNVTLKLVIVYLLVLGNFDKLILYAWLMFAVSVLMIILYRIFCIKHYPESHFHWIWDKKYLKPLLSFSGWDLYGNACVVFRRQGTNFLINMFFGVAYNAASSIATSVNGIIIGLASNVVQAYRPPIIKAYSVNNIALMQKHIIWAAQVMLLIYAAIMIPCFIEMPYLFTLWLQSVPEHSVNFCRFLLISSAFVLLNNILIICIHATGRIKSISMITGSIFTLCIPAIYIAFKLGAIAEAAYEIGVITYILILLCNILIIKRLIPLLRISLFVKQFLSIALVSFVSSFIVWLGINRLMNESLLRVILLTLSNLLLLAFFSYSFVLDKDLKSRLKKIICQRFQ